MKKLILLIGLLSARNFIAQDRKNDIMFSPIGMILGVGNASYEHHFNQNSGLGVSASFVFSNYVVEHKNWYVMPYYRLYFGQRWARGFFLEGSAGVTGRRKIELEINRISSFGRSYSHINVIDKTATEFGMGIGLGGKWDTKNNILFETSVGLGTTFHNEGVFLKGMLGVGYRF